MYMYLQSHRDDIREPIPQHRLRMADAILDNCDVQ